MASQFNQQLAIKTAHIMHTDPLAQAIDAELAEVRAVLLDCDSNLSAYGHGRPLTKEEALKLSDRARELYDKLRSD
jgi:hypothetical protein